MMRKIKIIALLITLVTTVAAAETETNKPVHLFILSGQSNMQGMDPATGFLPEAKKLFKDDEVVCIEVAKGGQPVCRVLEEWADIAGEKGMDARHRNRTGSGRCSVTPTNRQYESQGENSSENAEQL